MNNLTLYGPWAFIAGGSEGIGYSFASKLAEAGINLILVARRIGPLQDARNQLLAEHQNIEVEVHALDLIAADLPSKVKNIMQGKDIGLLIYNAGATNNIDLFVDESLNNVNRLIGLNCAGPSTLCHAVSKSMVTRGRGGIIIVSSLSGMAGSAYNVVYSAVKSFQMVLAEGLWAECKPLGVDVLCLIAGKTDTPSLGKLAASQGSADDSEAMTPDAVAEEGLANIANGPTHVAGEGNRAAAELLCGDRGQAIEILSSATAQMYSRPYPPQAKSLTPPKINS